MRNIKCFCFCIHSNHAQLSQNSSNWGIHNLDSVIISRVQRILASQNRFKSHCMIKYTILKDSSVNNPLISLADNRLFISILIEKAYFLGF